MIPPSANKTRRRRNKRSGFTLLELLMSLAMMAAIALILTSVLGVTGRALVRVGPERQTTELLLARFKLRDLIEAMPRSGAVSGSESMLSFQTLIDEPPYSARDLTTIIVSRDAGGVLVATATPPGIGDDALFEVLSPSDGVTRLSYFGSKAPFTAPGWHQDWPPASGLPELIRLDYGSADGAFPPLVVIPAIEARYSEMSLSSPLPPG